VAKNSTRFELYAIFDALVDFAVRSNISEIVGYCLPTAKNKVVQGVYDDLGFRKQK